jgi:hypothetical protein
MLISTEALPTVAKKSEEKRTGRKRKKGKKDDEGQDVRLKRAKTDNDEQQRAKNEQREALGVVQFAPKAKQDGDHSGRDIPYVNLITIQVATALTHQSCI